MSNKHEQGGTDVRQKNVLQKPLHQHSSTRSSASNDLPESVKTGFCNEQAPIAATLTNGFLDFSASKGLDLRSHGIGPGQRYCLEAARWKEARDAGMEDVPRVKLDCTHVKALDTVGYEELRKYAAGQDVEGVVWPKDRPGDGVRESGEIGGREPRA